MVRVQYERCRKHILATSASLFHIYRVSYGYSKAFER